ncbi:peptidyl-prolyl cis-trans isomerase [Aureococcus anophagefferens]|nr:peptidyl-prolyl cis-trans isomerase [Aureococcus anophagefferens]
MMNDPIVLEAISRGNPVTFFDVTIGGVPSGRIKPELFADETPKTAENFRQMCTGEFMRGSRPAGYLKLRCVIKEFMIQGGDILKGDGTGCISIYGESFLDENFNLRHSGLGLLSMANSGPDTNGSQFFVTCGKCDWLDGKPSFGKVLDATSAMVVHKIGNVQAGADSKPKLPAMISCGSQTPRRGWRGQARDEADGFPWGLGRLSRKSGARARRPRRDFRWRARAATRPAAQAARGA